jgi:hypothetical protein
MGDYLPPHSCDSELKGLLDAKRDLDRAWRAYESAESNLEAGEWGTAAGILTIFGCAFAATGIGAVICVAGGGAATIGGAYWTASAGEGLLNPMDDLNDAISEAEKAIAAACKCYDSHVLSEPD